MSTMNRDDARKRLKAGRAVLHEGRLVEREADLPAEEKGQTFADPRHADGTLTRAGMEAVIRAGGSVMHRGEQYARVEDLPAEHELAGADVARHDAAIATIDDQLTKLQAQKTTAHEARERAKHLAAQAEKDAPVEGKPRRTRARTAAETNDAGQPPEGDGLESMHVDDLLAKAEADRIDLGGATRKAEIIEAIRSGKKVEE